MVVSLKQCIKSMVAERSRSTPSLFFPVLYVNRGMNNDVADVVTVARDTRITSNV